jgi:Acyl-protein synthetase, LuxE.
MDIKNFEKQIFRIHNDKEFESLAFELFDYQYHNLDIYNRYCNLLNVNPDKVKSLYDIPFLPVDFFRTHRVAIESTPAKLIFSSSGTTGSQTSHHEVPYPGLYEESFTNGFEHFYGPADDYCILALLPSYLERSGSSLIYMAEHLIKDSKHPDSGFYLHNFEDLSFKLTLLKRMEQKTILLGVTYALLDLAEAFPVDFPDLIIMETGGMKGKRREMVREEVHHILKEAFGCPNIHSEYGMTELLSQAYSKGNGLYECPAWMKVMIRDMDDPFAWANIGLSGGINVIDLANIYSCSFIAIEDIGRMHENGDFEVLGRFDKSQIRGCNLLVY